MGLVGGEFDELGPMGGVEFDDIVEGGGRLSGTRPEERVRFMLIFLALVLVIVGKSISTYFVRFLVSPLAYVHQTYISAMVSSLMLIY